jgi:hypothetical protein
MRLSNYMSKMNYREIPLIWHARDWTGTRLSDIMDYQTAPTLTNVLTGNLFYCSIFRLISANSMPVA